MKKTIAILVCFLGFYFQVYSQTAASLSLPFFDDFARYDHLDSTKWVIRSSVFINNTYSKNPLTKNIATLNSVSKNGVLPPTVVLSVSAIDTLTSLPIDLSGYSGADSVYLSFYLQAGGIWNGPSSGAYLLVEFKNNANVWQQALRLDGPVTGFQNFAPISLPVTNAAFFHSNFQFRFRNVGRNGFNRDSWNLDYIFLNNNRSKLKADTFDIATSRPITPLLKRYTAMPIHQFNANIAGELSDSVTTTIANLGKRARSIALNTTINNPSFGPVRFSSKAVSALARAELPDSVFKPNPSLFQNLTGFQTIKQKIYLTTNEAGTATLYNDTITRVTYLQDFYAYDDGSAEDRVNALVPVNLGQVAIMFKANQPDMVKELRVYLPKIGNTQGTTATFRIWQPDPNSNNNPSSQSLFTHTFAVPALAQLDNWFIIPVNPPVPVNGEFYAGWSVNSSPNIFSIGADRNEPDHGKIRFFNGGNSWAVFNSGFAIMLRPVMNNNITGIAEDKLALENVQVYPNPASGFVTVQGKFETGTLLDITGRVVREFNATDNATRLDIQNLPAGLYLLKLQYKTAVQTQKLIINPN